MQEHHSTSTNVPSCQSANSQWRKGEVLTLLLAPKMNQSLWFHFVVDSMVIGSFLQFVLSSSSGKT
jgi:hypothetical protein